MVSAAMETILQSIYGEGFLSPEVGNDLRGIRLFIQITGITHTTEFDDNHRTEIEQKRARLTHLAYDQNGLSVHAGTAW